MQHPQNHPPGWRFVIDTTEDWVKQQQNWPANEQARQKEEVKNKEKEGKKSSDEGSASNKNQANEPKNQHESAPSIKEANGEKPTHQKQEQGGGPQSGTEHHWTMDNGAPDDEESRWKRDQGDSKKHDAYPTNFSTNNSSRSDGRSDDEEKSEYAKLRENYSPQEISLLRLLQHEERYMQNLGQNDGKMRSPVATQNELIEIDVADQFNPDNWIPRSSIHRSKSRHFTYISTNSCS